MPVQGVAALATCLKAAPLLVGLTAVALGTSAAEMTGSNKAVSIRQGDVAQGNVVGSKLSHLLQVLGA